MRKTAAIFVLTLFIFNLAGYKCWQYFLLQKVNTNLEASLDRQEYQEKDLIEFQIPLSNPYQLNTAFERVDGEIHIRGAIYKYVKRKVEDGKLILLCLPHIRKMQIVHVFGKMNGHSDQGASIRSPYPDECEELYVQQHLRHPSSLTQQHNISPIADPSPGYLQCRLAPPRTV